MATSTRVWPQRDDYQAVVLHPQNNLKDSQLHHLEVQKDKKKGWETVPFPRSGQFGCVYKFVDPRNPKKAFALKAFTVGEPDRQLRYRLIDAHLREMKKKGRLAPALVSFVYEDEGIQARREWWPSLTMEWVDGLPLRLYLKEALTKNGKVDNRSLCQAWVELILSLTNMGVAHGDLQHGNILVMPDRSLKLVDYDGMFVPAMRQKKLRAPEFGLPAYQHPKRNFEYFDERLDHFSALVVLLSLAVVDAGSWDRYRYGGDDNCLVVDKKDLLRPDRSSVLTELCKSSNAPVRKLAVLLRSAASKPLDGIPAFDRVVADSTIKQLLAGSWRPTPSATPPRPIVPSLDQMPVRQREVLALLTDGLTDEQIARWMAIDVAAVRGDMAKLMGAAQAKTRRDLSTWAHANGIKKVPRPPNRTPIIPPPPTPIRNIKLPGPPVTPPGPVAPPRPRPLTPSTPGSLTPPTPQPMTPPEPAPAAKEEESGCSNAAGCVIILIIIISILYALYKG